jgi:flagellar assembly factor FliW
MKEGQVSMKTVPRRSKMMIETTRFGALPIDENQVITFPKGLPGFEDCRRFTLVPHPVTDGDQPSPFEWLQSVEDGALAFLAMDPRLVFPHYEPALPPAELEDVALAGRAARGEAQLYALLTVPKGDPCAVTANLMAPVVINAQARLAKQIVIASDEYGLRHRLIPN